MIPTSNWISRLPLALSCLVLAGDLISPALAGQINGTPLPVSSGPGLGFVNIALVSTPSPNNDDVPGALPDNDIVVPQKRFDFANYIDTEFTVSTTSGVTEYSVIEGV